jgi:hypothetical protein
MDTRIYDDIRQRLERDYEFRPSSDRKWLRRGKCPTCSQKSMYTSAEKPWVLRCERSNRCGVEFHVKELYPEVFASWSDRYKATPANPNAAADAYLRNGRGFDIGMIAGWYSQENFYDADKRIGTATVRFPIIEGVWWERFIDRPERFGSQKANFRGAYGGQWWWPPSQTEIPDELWIVEGIFDAIALLHHGIAVAAAMTSVKYPDKALADLAARCQAEGKDRPLLVWALDGDKSGRHYAPRHARRAVDEGWTCTAAVIPFDKAKLDWNDMHQRGRLEPKDIEEYRYQGKLLLAEKAQDKALLIYHKKGWHSFHFGFDNRLHWFRLDVEKFNKASEVIEDNDKALSRDQVRDKALLEAGLVTEIANCYPTALYFQANKLTDESWYYFRVDFPHDGKSVNNTFTGGQLASPSEFKKRLLGIAPGAVFTGAAGQLDIMLKSWLSRIKTVDTVDFIGYSADHAAWVFNEVAVKDGKTIRINDEDFFDIGRLSIKSLNRSLNLSINTDTTDFATGWLDLLWQCYAWKGVAALAYWLGALFAEQIRDKYQSYPFIELVGEPGAGKSTLIEFLWRLVGRSDYEGFDPAKSTIAARSRNFSQVSNLPIVLIEGDRIEEDRAKQKGFDWDELKPLYNGRSVYARGVKNSGNETYEPPFRGALVISQNSPVSASDAIMQRICHIGFDLSSHTPETKDAADALGQIGVDKLSGFVIKACSAEKAILGTFAEKMPGHEKRLLKLPGVRNLRVVKNHAMLASLVDCLPLVLPVSAAAIAQTQAFIEDMTTERQEAINADHPAVQEFWDIYDLFNGSDDTPLLNHARNGDQEIAVNLNHFVAIAAERRQQIPDLRELKKLLKTSRARKFLGIKPVNSAINAAYNYRKANDSPTRPGTVKCWVFQQSA